NAQLAVATGSSSEKGIYNSYEVVDITVDALIKDQIAQVTVSQTIFNPGNHSLEVEIFFPLPDKGAVQDFILMVDGKEVPGELLEKNEAQKIFEGIVRSKRDPALMEYVGYGLFKTRIFPIGIHEKRKISVSYTQVCNRKLNAINFSYPFGTQKFSARALEHLSLNAQIITTVPIKTIYSPSDDIKIKRNNDYNMIISMEKNYVIPDHDFKLTLGLNDGDVGTTILSYKPKKNEDGYFMLLASPALDDLEKEEIQKTIIFVLDRSGSMAGKKIEQSISALKFMINNLNHDDLFNIITYDNRVHQFKTELERYDKESHTEAMDYIQAITSGGGTNINEALTSAMNLLKNDTRPAYVLFLTDGLPTVGIVNEMEIAKNCKMSNKMNARVFSFGVGYDVNARLLDRISEQNCGISEYVKPNENLETVLGSFYNNISAPVLTKIQIAIDNTRIDETYPKVIPDIFKGNQLVWIGRYSNPGKTYVTIKGYQGNEVKTFKFPAVLNSNNDNIHAYLEKIWATRKVGYLIDQIDLHGKNEELVSELVKLSKNYGILTPYTAFLAREDVDLNNVANNVRTTNTSLEELNVTSGVSGNAQRATKKAYKESQIVDSAPIAYDLKGKSEEIISVRNIGTKTFYWKNNNWIESTLTKKEINEAAKIKQFSNEYFELTKGQTADMNQCLSIEENLLVRVNGRVYNIIK
ncbi:VIT domain-containing protein, partial [candidate division KSB1 bacterium]